MLWRFRLLILKTTQDQGMLFKNIVNDSLVFHSHYESAKAKEIENNPNVSGLFFWPEIYRANQI